MEKISIIGMASRFPGSRGVAQYWDRLKEGSCHVGSLLPERFPENDFVGLNPDHRKTLAHLQIGQIERPFFFDPTFFGMSEREAIQLDPQQRLLMMATWEALEDAGVTTADLQKSTVGVYVGANSNDYCWRQAFRPDLMDAFTITGNTLALIANRISYHLGAKGPSFTLDSACSSALSALSIAVDHLRNGTVDLAIVGSGMVITSPILVFSFSEMGIASPSGRCRFGSRDADGYVRGEGLGIVVLRKTRDTAPSDRIYAEILDCRIGASGKGRHIVVPQLKAQRDLIQEVYRRHGVLPRDIAYMEAHGTGTPVGDLVELNALARVFGTDRGRTLHVGSVKSNIGHLEPASGMAALIKTALSIHHQTLVPSLHCLPLREDFDFEKYDFKIPQETRNEEIPFAGVSSYGFGGTLAHVLLKKPDSKTPRLDRKKPQPRWLPVVFSAHSRLALQDLLARVVPRLPDGDLGDLSYTTYRRRSRLPHRAVFFASSILELRERIERRVRAQDPSDPEISGPCAMIFAGAGARWIPWARTLRSEPAYRELFDSLLARAGISIDLDRALEEDLGITELQLGLFAHQISLYRFWVNLGLRIDVVLGHSMGEVAAAVAAGIYDEDQGIAVARARAEALQRAKGRGKMFWTSLPRERWEGFLKLGSIEVAAVNGPRSVVLSVLDSRATLPEEDFKEVRSAGIPAHSSALDDALSALDGVPTGQISSGPLFWSTTRAAAVSGENLTPAYWKEQVRNPVLFQKTIEGLSEQGTVHWLDPAGIHAIDVEETLQSRSASAPFRIHSLAGGAADLSLAMDRFGEWISNGLSVDLEISAPENGALFSLPTYPWQEKHFELPTANYPGFSEGPRSGKAEIQSPLEATDEPIDPKSFLLGCARDFLGGIEPQLDVPLREYGMDSISAIGLRSRLSKKFARAPSLDFLMGGPPIREILRRMGPGSNEEEPAVRTLKEPQESTSIHLVCFPFGGGGSTSFLDWVPCLPGDWGLSVVTRPTETGLSINFASYLSKLVSEYPSISGRPVLLGYSMGAHIAGHLLHALKSRNLDLPSAVVMASARCVDSVDHIHTLLGLSDKFFELWLEDLGQAQGPVPTEVMDHVRTDLTWAKPLTRAQLSELYDLPLLVCRGEDDRYVGDADLQHWKESFPNARLFTLPGGHFFPSQDPGGLASLISD